MSRSTWLVLALALTLSKGAHADVLSVGPNGSYPAPCAAFAAAADGDTIEIDSAGTYQGDVCPVTNNKLTIRGTPGLAKIDANGMNSGGKGTWVVQGDDTTVERIEFLGAAVPDLNGAGIRQEGKSLTVRGCFFHDNENGILGGDGPESELLIETSEFFQNGAGDGYSHNLYIGHAGKLTFRYNWSHGSVIGHLLKSRAAENYILYNRITGEDGSSSYELNFPNGGKTYIIGNLIEQGPDTDNPSLLAYIEEGTNAANPSHQLYVVNNTFVNHRGNGGTFLQIADGGDPAVVTNNIFFGGGTVINQANAVLSHNSEAEPCLVDDAGFDYQLLEGSPCVDAGEAPGDGDGFALLPTSHYVHPHSSTGRASVGTIDIGAYELGGDAAPEGGTGNAQAGSSPGAGGKPSGGGASNTGGTSNGSPGGTANGVGGGASGAAHPESDSGCGCRAVTPSTPRQGALLVLVLASAALVRRRRYGQ